MKEAYFCPEVIFMGMPLVQVLCKQGWHLLFTSRSDFCKHAQKPHKKMGQFRYPMKIGILIILKPL